MKKSMFLVTAGIVLNSFCYAGGNILPVVVEPAEIEEVDDRDFYIGGALTPQRTYGNDADWFSDEIAAQDKTIALTGILGYKINDYLAIEGRIGKNFWEKEYADVTTYSLFLKPMYPINEDFSVYGLLGYGNVTVDGNGDSTLPATKSNGENIVDENSFQWGVGLSYVLNEDFSLFIDYTMLMNETAIPLQALYAYDNTGGELSDHISDDTVNIGIMYHF